MSKRTQNQKPHTTKATLAIERSRYQNQAEFAERALRLVTDQRIALVALGEEAGALDGQDVLAAVEQVANAVQAIDTQMEALVVLLNRALVHGRSFLVSTEGAKPIPMNAKTSAAIA